MPINVFMIVGDLMPHKFINKWKIAIAFLWMPNYPVQWLNISPPNVTCMKELNSVVTERVLFSRQLVELNAFL